ncbi:MAG: phosphoribosyl-ATP diphosphatase [Spirochaetaceae bacterium]|nr:phosphoribosyl-ATP diphosphatase [Spirochaetaceae bacterium]
MEKKAKTMHVEESVAEQDREEDAQLLDAVDEESDSGNQSKIRKETPEASAVRPLIVCDENGGFLFFTWTNTRGYNKSIEQGALWVAHPETDRILPSGKEARLRQIQDRGDYYYAEVMVEENAPETRKAAASSAESGRLETPKVLTDLVALIARRRKEKPEGSYTTYLFQEGPEKIRKKTGEEAVELILARTPKQIVYEAADLIYHMLVLLEAEDIAVADVLKELKSRG